MNHGFAVDAASLPENVEQTHVSLFDGTNCGIAIKGKRAFAVQYHPEASPGPQDSFYLFEKFVGGCDGQLPYTAPSITHQEDNIAFRRAETVRDDFGYLCCTPA